MSALKIAICDDDEIQLAQLERRVRAAFQIRNTHVEIDTMRSPEQMFNKPASSWDVVFLDVNLGNYNGVDVAHHLRQQNLMPLIVFVSGYIQYAVQGYHVNAFRYLLKDDLEETLQECVDGILSSETARRERYVVRHGGEDVEIFLDNIVYIESQRTIALFHVEGKENIEYKCYDTLQTIEEKLKSKGFLRIQKSYVVNLNHVADIRNYKVELTNGMTFQARRSNFADLRRLYMLWKGNV